MAEEVISEGLTIFQIQSEYRLGIRTVNILAQLNKKIKQRIKVATLFPDTESCLPLVSAVAMELAEEWQAGRIYLKVVG